MTDPRPPLPWWAIDGLRAELVRRPDEAQVLTYVRNGDARTALARGLVEYLSRMEVVAEGGHRYFFKGADFVWASPEQPAGYPSLVLVGLQDAEYEASVMTPAPVQAEDGTKRWLRQAAELVQVFQLIVWAQDPMARVALCALVEDALEPHDWQTGLRLRLPYYFGAHATYEKLSLGYDDQGGDAQRGWRRGIFTVRAHVPQLVPWGKLPDMKVRVRVEDEPLEAGSA